MEGFGREGAQPPPVFVPFRIGVLPIFTCIRMREGSGGEKDCCKCKKSWKTPGCAGTITIFETGRNL